MNKFIQSLQSYSGILLLMLLVVVVILLVCVFNLSLGLNRLNRKYALFMKGKDGQSLENIQKLEKMQGLALNKYSIVKYDAFEDMGGKLSFVLAMLDSKNTGFLLNAIHSRENCFLYVKEIVNGESYVMLSGEEIEALKRAVNFGIEESEFDIFS